MRGAWREKEGSIPLAATAIVVPVYNEDVGRVTRGIANMWRSLEKTGQLEHFDFYICSDSNDADHWVEEECAWLSLCQKLNAFGKIFYRKRRHRINGKSGNVADFCRRWGKRYRYMIVLDADSVMAGPTLVRLVRAMEANPTAGIIQTQPYMVLGHIRSSGACCNFPARFMAAFSRRVAAWRRCRRARTGATTPSFASRRSSSIATCRSCPSPIPASATS